MCVAVASVQVSIRQFLATLSVVTVDAEAVECVADQGGVARAASVMDAVREVMVMISPSRFRVPLAVVLYLVSDSVTTTCVECVEEVSTA
jgi:hypothetical protein